jgi:hypothetical protein
MNDRIKELAKQAEVKWLHQEDVIYSTMTLEQFEKFAELIVAECMEMCDNVSADYLKHRKAAFDFQDKHIYAEGEAACDIIKYKMKKHFGVEE